MIVKLLVTLCLFLLPASCSTPVSDDAAASPREVLYDKLGLAGNISFDIFETALENYYGVSGRRREILTLIDFTKPSTEERLWVIDMAARQVLFRSHVAHGRGSGELYAERFSNTSGSHQSSPGVYLTEGTYIGRNGYSLVIDGLEPGVNDNAKARAVVIHGADYADPALIPSMGGRLGRSHGCPALPRHLAAPIIDAIKDGSVLYIHANS